MSKAHHPLLDNSRFYILVCSFLASVAVFAWLRMTIGDDQLLAIRTQQAYGFISVTCLYVALIVSPLGYVVGTQRVRHLAFARRAIGVSAFYFAALHALVALYGQLGGLASVQYLPELFQLSLLGGAIALGVLGLMAATSFDVAIRCMTFRRWKWLHRFVYASGVLIILHVWTIGTHMAYPVTQAIGFSLIGLLLGLELFRVTKQINKRYQIFDRFEATAVFVALWGMALVLLASLPFFVQNYHSRHLEHDSGDDRSTHGYQGDAL